MFSRLRQLFLVFPFGKWRRALALNRGRRRLFATRKLRFRRQPKSIAKE
jgi:hypothetical protein